MIALLREIGRGKRGSRDLTYEEALRGALSILEGEATTAQTAAFLMAQRMKMESTDELRAFVDALRSRCTVFPIADGIDCAGPYDGRVRTFIATVPTAFVLAACGLPVTLHGSPSLPPKRGIAVSDVLEALGAPVERLTYTALTEAAVQSGFIYVPTEQWCPPLGRLRAVREELGMRTIFNTAEKLLRPTDASAMAVGVFHGTVFERMSELLLALGVQDGIVVQGLEGSEDIGAHQRTRAYRLRDGQAELFIIDPDMYELQSEMIERIWTPEQQAEASMSVLTGDAELGLLNPVLLNSAVRLWVSHRAGSIEEGIYMARHAIEQGEALLAYKRWLSAVLSRTTS
ncbi:anthranilate phosphoribosyltransferase [Paenibacillus sp. YYML68]|uniref:anthranilate phosphoribosyltransferase n=1 Tax=Paenibacillus sp. YYML68 TaxID=2909250 RepID=UPI002493395A|nr:anthranilate phosphoribosyltransferase [Paenibacillus sp. YYML68]